MTRTDRQPYKGKTSEKMLDHQSKHGKKRSSFTCTSLILITCIYCLIIVNRSLKKYSFWWTKKQTWINLHNKQRWINIPVLAPVTIAVLPCNLISDTKGFFMDTSYSFTAVRTIPTNKQNPQNMEIRSIAIFKDCNFKEALILAFSLTDQI